MLMVMIEADDDGGESLIGVIEENVGAGLRQSSRGVDEGD